MAATRLDDYQIEAVRKLHNGSILCGDVGSGKSRVGLAYYYTQQGGVIGSENYVPGPGSNIQDLYIITTARKRDTMEWEGELAPFLLSSVPGENSYNNKVVIDSWNNIGKYIDISNAFFLFDEQRVVGKGAWVKSFLKITKNNNWILLSATPGDTWMDYIPVFIANGFYKNRSEFLREHVVYRRFSKWPQVDRYLSTGRLLKYRRQILVNIDYEKPTVRHQMDIYTEYNSIMYKDVFKNRWNVFTDDPITNATELCYVLRRIVNTDVSRQEALLDIVKHNPKVIVFYNFNYELDILKSLNYGSDYTVAEWNGHVHEKIPTSKKWVYLVQYSAGAEGWNCIETDTMVFYSQNYSYKIMYQAAGRIDRRNTSFKDLYYYYLKSRSSIDIALTKAFHNKRNFEESAFMRKFDSELKEAK